MPHSPPPGTLLWIWQVSRNLNTNQDCCRVTRPRWLRSRQYYDLKMCSAVATSTFFAKCTHFLKNLTHFWSLRPLEILPKINMRSIFQNSIRKYAKLILFISNHVRLGVCYTARTRSRCLKVFVRRSLAATESFLINGTRKMAISSRFCVIISLATFWWFCSFGYFLTKNGP